MAFNQLHHIQENTISVSNGVFGDHGQKFHNVSQQNSKTLSFYGRGVRNIGASRKTITIQADGINEKCFFVILAGATDTRCVTFIYGLKTSSDEVNYTDIINNKVSFSGSREDNTITINSGNWSRGMIYSYEPFTVETT